MKKLVLASLFIVVCLQDRRSKSVHVQEGQNVDYCDDTFHVMVEANQEVKHGETVSTDLYPIHDNQNSMSLGLFTSPDKNPRYVDDAGCKEAAQMTLSMLVDTHRRDRPVKLSMEFGGTEVKVLAKDQTSGSEVRCKLDFLAAGVNHHGGQANRECRSVIRC